MAEEKQPKPKIVQLCWAGARIAGSTLNYLKVAEPIPADRLPGNEEGLFMLKMIAGAHDAIRLCTQDHKNLEEPVDFDLTALETEMKRVFPSGSSPATQR